MFKYLLNSFLQVFNIYYIYIHIPYIHILIMYYLMYIENLNSSSRHEIN
jgi:hypothetical protein